MEINNIAMRLQILETDLEAGEGGTAYNGLYGEAPRERGTFFRLRVYKRVGIYEVYKTVGNRSFRYLEGPLIIIFRIDAPYG